MEKKDEKSNYIYEENINSADKICEPEPAYKAHGLKRQGEYTVEDYLAWPEDHRIELIDGVI